MATIPLVPETKMVDVSKLISLGNLLVRKVTWFVLTTTSASLILSHLFGAHHMTRIAYIYSRHPRTHSLHFDFQKQHSLSLSSFSTSRNSTLFLCLHFRLPETALSFFVFDFQKQHSLSLSSFSTSRNSTLFLSLRFRLPETALSFSLFVFVFQRQHSLSLSSFSTSRNSLTLLVSKDTIQYGHFKKGV